MKLNQKLIKRLADGEIAYHHTGTDEQWEQIKKACDFKNHLPFCKEIETPIYCTKKTKDNYFEYYVFEENPIRTRPVFTTQQFYEVETETTPERSERIPETEQPISKIELFKQLCASSYQLKSVQSFDHQIEKAWEFTEMVYEKINLEISATDKE